MNISGYAAAEAADSRSCSRQEEMSNKEIIASLRPGSSELYSIMDTGYTQHNPEYVRFGEINGIHGRQVVEVMDKYHIGMTGKRLAPLLPGQPPPILSYRLIAECDLVVQVNEIWHPYPQAPGKYYASYFFNMWRLTDGKLEEHWDPDDMPSPLPDYLKVPVGYLRFGGTSNTLPAH